MLDGMLSSLASISPGFRIKGGQAIKACPPSI
jgi:hypothetical protein